MEFTGGAPRHHVFQQNPQAIDRTCNEFANEVETIANAVFKDNKDPNTNSYPHNVNTFMDRLASRFTELSNATDVALLVVFLTGTQLLREFGSRGFITTFQDPQADSSNQARHAIFGLIMGFTAAGALGRNLKLDARSPLEVANDREERNTESGLADRALNNITVPMGESLHGPGAELRARDLPSWIRNNLCAR